MTDQGTLGFILSYSFTYLKHVVDEVFNQVVVLVLSCLDQGGFVVVVGCGLVLFYPTIITATSLKVMDFYDDV